jgi:tRNA pseudouridine55 synthase
VDVNVTDLELLSFADDVAEVRLVCSSGFYVRSLAHDAGARLGCGAHLAGLRRTRAGEFTLADAVTLDALVTSGAKSHLVPMGRLLGQLPSVVLTVPGVRRVGHGADVGPDDVEGPMPKDVRGRAGERWRLLDANGQLLALAENRAGGLLHPVVVLV